MGNITLDPINASLIAASLVTICVIVLGLAGLFIIRKIQDEDGTIKITYIVIIGLCTASGLGMTGCQTVGCARGPVAKIMLQRSYNEREVEYHARTYTENELLRNRIKLLKLGANAYPDGQATYDVPKPITP